MSRMVEIILQPPHNFTQHSNQQIFQTFMRCTALLEVSPTTLREPEMEMVFSVFSWQMYFPASLSC